MKIAIVGCAHIHMPSFVKQLREHTAKLPVAAVWDRDPARAAKYTAELDAPVVPDAGTIWRDASIEAVVIASETCFHRELVIAAAKSGKHLFVEKPLGFSAADAQAAADAVEASGKIFQTGYFMRGLPAHLFLKQKLAEGAFGTVTRVRHSNCHSGLYKGWFDADWRWMADPAVAGCGAFGDLGTHSLDILMWLFGKPKTVFAAVRTLDGRYGQKCDEYGEGMLFYPDGMIATLAAGWLDPVNPVTCEICGTRGHAAVIGGKVYFQSALVPGSDISQPVAELPEMLPHAFTLYLDALAGKRVPLVGVREAADRNLVMEALYRAAAEGRTVAVG